MNIIYTGYELLWLFFFYSFLGWILETVTAAVKQKRFVNRGIVNLPFCVLYGITAVFITLFCGELNGLWLFTGSAILATIFEWTAGHLIEKIYHEKWWDYSDVRFNFDGYICLPASSLWGVLGFVIMKWGNGLLLQLFHVIPRIPGNILIWALFTLLALDIIATLIITRSNSRNIAHWKAVDNWLSKITSRLSHRIYRHVEARIKKAYPQAMPIAVA